MTPVLAVTNLTKRFGAFTAVDDVSFEIAAGASVGIVGESGSGKTTLARMIIGLETPTTGSISCCGNDRSAPARSTRARRARARETQIVFQDPYASLDPHQTVRQALTEAASLHIADRRDSEARVRELADLVAIDERQLASVPKHLSGGQRQRVAIARALAAGPRVLVLDESVAALDVSIQAQILNLLADIRDRTGISYLFISHDLAVIRQVTEYSIVMRTGVVVERGDTETLLRTPAHPYTQALLASVPRPGWKPSRKERSDRDAPDTD
ncbi:Oligopeptide/dipeptide transporter, C-terminal region [Amycolatopsis xylanica]|uniref:Oligopeptide/dipeptide transporter, C-terminal region n=1 Tax=Amycolatopsis xylanica TaxID=589385 RepID=A0A1H3CVV2_9PSEU|nr:ATP-binding cassette domain-containing protein [Amycolatopsis xylanica]SDX57684.1 Oligopeptide/dipeptide transporter, C-terminal region [Amycolatopsis xylanica]